MDPARANASGTGASPGTAGLDRLPVDLRTLLDRLNLGLGTLYGGRYRGMVLYGSYARGDADEGSDVDLLLILEGEVDPAREILRAEEVKWPLALESGYAVSLLPVGLEVYRLSKEPFLSNIREEGFPAA